MTSAKKQVAYIVTRSGEQGERVPIGVFADLLEADNMLITWQQEFKERGIEGYTFEICACALYD